MDAVGKELRRAEPQQGDEALRREVQALLRADPSNPSRLVSRENSRLEYKETFDWRNRAKYAKSMAAFANKRGGFIVFGVKNSPHDIIGVNPDRFRARDPAEVAQYLNSAFAPEIEWEAFEIELAGFQLGIIAVKPAATRPVMCIKNDGKILREADIYYRYEGRSERIQYSELQRLLAERQDRERDAWLQLLSKIARIGVENVGVLDFTNGELTGQGGRLVVSEDLLDQVQFIREGHFAERRDDCAPTLRLVGNVQPVAVQALNPAKTIAQPLAIGQEELMGEFLRQNHPSAPKEYIKQACRESSPYMPVYHFARAAGLGLEALRDLIDHESTRRNGLPKRVGGSAGPPVGSIDSDTPSSNQRRRILEQLKAGDTQGLRGASPVRLLEAVTHFQPANPPAELLRLLADLLEDGFANREPIQRTLFRKAVAHLDEVLNRTECSQLVGRDMAI